MTSILFELKKVRRAFTDHLDSLRCAALERKFRFAPLRMRRRKHDLPRPLVVTLTSYPKRFEYLHYNLMSLLSQETIPDRVVLWIAFNDKELIPTKVLRLEAFGLEIKFCEDLRSFKKLIPAIKEFPDHFLVTADDDIVYPKSWLTSLTVGYDTASPAIVCRRAHRFYLSESGFAPYMEWDFNVDDEPSLRPSMDLLPVGVGGVLYPPGSLHSDVTDKALFGALCPDGDDLWFWWMGRRRDSRVRRVASGKRLQFVPGSQEDSLMTTNWSGGNDRQLAALVAAFGFWDVRLPPEVISARIIG